MIFIRKIRKWAESYPLLKEALGNYYTNNESDAKIVLEFSGYSSCCSEGRKVLNKNASNIADKIRMNKMLDKLQILHPKTWYSLEEIPRELRISKTKLCVVKRRYTMGGKNIRFVPFKELKGLKLDDNEYFFQYYVPFEKEYRIVVFNAEIISAKRKIPFDESVKIRNLSDSKFIKLNPNIQANRDVMDFALEVANKFQIDFTGTDIGKFWNRFLVIELNSAAGLTPTTARILAKKLIELYKRL